MEIYLLNTGNGKIYNAMEDEDGIWLLDTDEHEGGRYVKLGKTWQRAR